MRPISEIPMPSEGEIPPEKVLAVKTFETAEQIARQMVLTTPRVQQHIRTVPTVDFFIFYLPRERTFITVFMDSLKTAQDYATKHEIKLMWTARTGHIQDASSGL